MMQNSLHDAVHDWHRSVVSYLAFNNPSKLAEYALHLARIIAYPELDVIDEISKIDNIGRIIIQSNKEISNTRPTQIIAAMNNQLYKIENFKGNRDDYYNPSNSFLNIVLKRKLGIPITLSILYIRIAQLLKFELHPINFPSHFLVKHVLDGENNDIIIDPYNEGRIMDDYSLKQLLDQTYPKLDVPLTRNFVEKSSDARVIIRMLNNLKSSYFECNDIGNAELVNEMALKIDKNEQYGIRDRGMISFKRNKNQEALSHFNQYIEKFPEAEDIDMILDIIRKIRRKN